MRASRAELLRLLRGRLPSADELEAIRARRLRSLVHHAYGQVPYYRRMFESAGLGPEDIRGPEDLRHLPVSSREDLRAGGEDLLARDADPASGTFATTSGSTGKPIPVFHTRHEDRLRRALDLRSLRWAGARPRDVIAFFGLTRPPPRRPLKRFGVYRTWDVSTLLPVEEQILRLQEIRPTVLWIYPSVLRQILRQAGSLETVARPRLLIHSAEPLDDVLRQRVRRAGIETRNFYGAVETGRIAWECGVGEGLHINADCSIVEHEEGTAIPGAGGSVVVTNLNNFAMPLIRYRLGDRAELLERSCPCGVALPLMKPPLGRLWDLIVLPSGKLLSPFPLSALLRDLGDVDQFRFIQKSREHLAVEVSFLGQPPPGAVEWLRSRVLERLREPMRVDVEVRESIADDAHKFRVFISEVPPPLEDFR